MANQPTIPAPPWTYEALGSTKYWELSKFYCGNTDPGFKPDLDLTEPYKLQQAGSPAPKVAEKKEG